MKEETRPGTGHIPQVRFADIVAVGVILAVLGAGAALLIWMIYY